MRLAIPCLFAASAFAACIPDPKGEYDDYVSRTKNFDGGATPAPNLDASIDTKPPDTATESLYVGICVTALANKDPSQALRFYTESKFTPDPGGGGKLTLTLTPMVGWDPTVPPSGQFTQPKTVSKSETRGSGVTLQDIQVAAGAGRFTANLGTVNLPPEANSLSGRPAIIDNTTLDGRFGDPEFCSTLGGQLKVPYEYTFNPADNTCLFVKVKEGDPLPTKTADQFVCPL